MMNTLFSQSLKTLTLAAGFAAFTLAGAPITVTPAVAGELELTDAQNAKLARHRAKERVLKNEKQENYLPEGTPDNNSDDGDDDCGSVDIGNVVNNAGFGGPREIDVIITGDIINANNKCN